MRAAGGEYLAPPAPVQYDGERADRYEELEAADLVEAVQPTDERKTRDVRLNYALLSDAGGDGT